MAKWWQAVELAICAKKTLWADDGFLVANGARGAGWGGQRISVIKQWH
jgi:hypothetical protein